MNDLILSERETKEKLVDVINKSNLPAFILRSMIKDLYEQISQVEQQQYQEALKSKQKKKGEKDE